MSKQKWPTHVCDKMPDRDLIWTAVLIVKAPHQTHID